MFSDKFRNNIPKVNANRYKKKKITQIVKGILFFLLSTIVLSNAQAIILYSGDNNANLSAPDSERSNIFNSVAKITNADGTGIIGSAVHIKNKYLLTAEHVLYKNVTPRRSHVSFDGNIYWAIDLEFSPIQIDTADLVLFKLIEDPNLPETQLYNLTNELNKTGTLIGWGYGRDANQADQTSTTRSWTWGAGSTIDKRWGTNQIANIGNADISGNVYDYLQTRLNSNQGSNEAAFAYYDSGSGLYISNSGTWQTCWNHDCCFNFLEALLFLISLAHKIVITLSVSRNTGKPFLVLCLTQQPIQDGRLTIAFTVQKQ